MIHTVGVTQVKYCYRMNINSVQIQFIRYAFHSNQLQAEDTVVGSLLPWAKEHFKKRPWMFQQDSAPSHRAKKTQE